VCDSPHDVDRLHVQFADECIDHAYGRHDAQPQVILVPERVARATEWLNPSGDVVTFENREIIRYKPGFNPLRAEGNPAAPGSASLQRAESK
jgi:hypothetical protein